ncbi:MAG: ATP-dependent zinc metalloprotease FtsH [Spirochaetales bacterium]|nr:ATP-dependent zinc metalloprotease FtsH [Spirochaetales bacterium]
MEDKQNNSNNSHETSEDKKNKNKHEPGIHNYNPFSKENSKRYHFSFWYFIIMIVILVVINSMFQNPTDQRAIEYNVFKDKIVSGEIKRVEITETEYIGYTMTREQIEQTQSQGVLPTQSASQPMSYTTYKVDDPNFIPLLDEQNVDYYSAAPQNTGVLFSLLGWFLPLIILIVFWQFLFKKMNNQGGQGVMSFGQNKTKIVAEGDTGVRFKDVAGVDESKMELEEVVDFLKRPERYTEIGGKIPKGMLLVGPPGTGKTLLARAVAGEAGVPFFRMSGADFVEMFVGVGAARVRDLFRQAREKAPCIIFIDEMDAIGKTRQASLGSNDEREQTLNQLLVEMDGFDARIGVIIIGATNRPEILDPALLRPGRFDRQVLIPKPDLIGREAILNIHSKSVKVSKDVDMRKVAQATAGLAGADLANIVNEAALLAVRAKRKEVIQEDLSEAIEKTFAGLERKNRVMNKEERKRIAYHETGHAITAYFTKGSDPVSKISIVPRGMAALGYTLQLPTEDRFLLSEHELLSTIDVMMGGRAAEQIEFREISTGASNDISRASDLVRRMITEFGMSGKFRNITLPTGSKQSMLGTVMPGNREYSEETQQYIDTETARIVNERYDAVADLLEKNHHLLKSIADLLLDKEVLEGEEFKKIIDDDLRRRESEETEEQPSTKKATAEASASSAQKKQKKDTTTDTDKDKK